MTFPLPVLPRGWSRSYPATVDAECGSCPYWRRPYAHEADQEHGECRREAPGTREDAWPATSEDDWCGRHPALAAAPAGTWSDEDERFLWRKS